MIKMAHGANQAASRIMHPPFKRRDILTHRPACFRLKNTNGSRSGEDRDCKVHVVLLVSLAAPTTPSCRRYRIPWLKVEVRRTCRPGKLDAPEAFRRMQ